MNTIAITGNLGADPEVRYTSEGMPIASFSLAFKSSKGKTGWVKIVCFKNTAELVEKHLHVGAKVGITGLLDQDTWKNNEGEKRSMHKVIANKVDFLKTDGRGFDDDDE